MKKELCRVCMGSGYRIETRTCSGCNGFRRTSMGTNNCYRCYGSGNEEVRVRCLHCNGTGERYI